MISQGHIRKVRVLNGWWFHRSILKLPFQRSSASVKSYYRPLHSCSTAAIPVTLTQADLTLCAFGHSLLIWSFWFSCQEDEEKWRGLQAQHICINFKFSVGSRFHALCGEGNGNPLQCSCLENPRDGGAWWAAVYGAAQSWTRPKRLSSSSSRHASCKTDG